MNVNNVLLGAVAIFELSTNTMKLGLVLFWGLWLGLVLLNNVLEGLRALRLVPPYWKFASNNLEVIREAAGRYQAPLWVPNVLFLGVLLWELGTLILFGRAGVLSLAAGELALGAVNSAFAGSIALLAAFIIADEILQLYDLEHSHVLFLIAQIVTLLAVHMMPA